MQLMKIKANKDHT